MNTSDGEFDYENLIEKDATFFDVPWSVPYNFSDMIDEMDREEEKNIEKYWYEFNLNNS
jgi:hypothetical protein